ncbi:hypothetical protein Tco_1576681 [Tanacetum coccineum]
MIGEVARDVPILLLPMVIPAALGVLADPDEDTAMVRQSEEEVVTEQSKKVKKRRLQKQSDVLLAKKLRTDHPTLASGDWFGGKKSFPDARSVLDSSAPNEPPICITNVERLFNNPLSTGQRGKYVLGREVRSRTKHELELKEKLRVRYDARGRLLEKKHLEIQKLKSKLAEKEAKAVEVIRLHDQVSSLSEEKYALTAEVSVLRITITQKYHDISLLDSRATSLVSTLDDSKVSSLRAGFQDFKERMEVQQEQQAQELYNRVAELEAHIIDLALLKCLKSPEYQGILGHALGRAVDFGMQEGLEAGHEHGIAERSLSAVDAYNPEAARARYVDAVKALEDVDFPLVSLLKSKKDAGMDEVLDCFLLDGPLAVLPEAAYLQPCIEQLSVPIHHAGDTTAVGETSLSFALMNVHARAEGAKKHAAALRQLMMDIVSAPLSSQTWVGEASTSVAPLSVEDYDEEDTDEALGSVVAVPKFETCRF